MSLCVYIRQKMRGREREREVLVMCKYHSVLYKYTRTRIIILVPTLWLVSS